MSRPRTRRSFLGQVGASAGVAAAFPRAARLARGRSANERIGLGIIGVGGLGGGNHHLGRVVHMADFELLAVCDVDRGHIEKATKKAASAGVHVQGYRDYRQLLARKDIDAVIIATPDHWHALTAVHACQAGKDVYCEKPLSLTVAEGRAMSNAARRYGRVFQTGTQQRSDWRFRWAAELVRNGKLGKLRSVDVVIGKGPVSELVPNAPVPSGLDWDFWLGPAPKVAYNPKRCHYLFRWFYDYSGGRVTDWGAHHHDIVQWALGTELSGPRHVHASGVWPAENFFETAVDFDIEYRYANGVVVHTTGRGKNGITFHGSRGELFVRRGGIRATPEEILDDKVGTMPIRLYASDNHHQNFADCVRSRSKPISDVELSHRSASMCHIGNISMRLDRALEWDATAERFRHDEMANRLLAKPMRGEWSL